MVGKNLRVVYAAGISLGLLSVLVFFGILGTNPIAGTAAYGTMIYDKGNSGNSSTMMKTYEMSMTRLAAAGNIANVQLGSNGEPAWIQSGILVMRASFGQGTNEPQSVSLIARFTMVAPDGSARHMHKIYGFQPTEFTTEQNNTIHVVKGTATVTMRDGPVSDVPLTIKIFNGSVVGLWIGPDKLDAHFGSDPIYGILSARSMAMMMEMGPMKGDGQMTDYIPTITPSNFVSAVNNPYYTLTPGAIYTYQSETDEGTERNIVIVTNETREILGVTATVVWDRVWLDEELTEETFDWYAQDKAGNVWYMGEDSTEYEDGEAVSTKGSWEAGVDGAKPGIIMEANPQVGDTYRQEYYAGEAEDMAEVVSLGETVTVPFGTFSDCVKTREWSPIDPELNENKFHCSEVGTVVLEVVIDTGEKVELVDVA